MTKALEELENWFPSGTAEGERAILERVFVYADELRRALSPKPGNPLLLVGRKGTGKSAIIEFAMRLLDIENIPAVVLQPKDIPTSDLSDNDAMGDLRRKFYEILLSSVAAKLAEDARGLLTGDQATLYNHAVGSGQRKPDFLGQLARLLPQVAKPVAKVDLSSVLPSLTAAAKGDLQDAIANSLIDKRLHVFIDDTDQVANPDKPGHLNRIWGLILAARDLASKVPEVCILITLREEIWHRLQREGAAQRDQTDHFTNLVITMSSSDDHVKNIVDTRLRAAKSRLLSNEDLYDTFFDGLGAHAPHSPDFRSWEDLIVVRSRQRPRDAIQLIGSLADHALRKQKREKIDEETFHAVMPIFSERRANLYAQEVEDEFPAALEVVRSFADANYEDGGFRLTADQARSHIEKLNGRFPISLYGRSMRPHMDNDLFDIWKFLYISNFLNARVSDDRQKNGYRHIASSDDPTLVSKARWNEMQGMLWEVNPAFRDYLISRQVERAAMTGLPVRQKKGGGRGKGRAR